MNYTPVFIGVLILLSVVGTHAYYPKWFKWVAGGYYVILVPLFGYLQSHLAEKWFVHTPVSDQYWDENARLVDIFAALFFIPAFLLIVSMYYNLYKHAKSSDERKIVGLSSLPTLILVLLIGAIALFAFEFTYGYRP